MAVQSSSKRLRSGLRVVRVARVYRCANLLPQTQVVAHVPDLGNLSIGEPKEIHAGKAHAASCRTNAAPDTAVRARDRPPRDDEVSLGNERFHLEASIGKGRSKLLCDCLLPGGPWWGVATPQVVTNVVGPDELVRSVEVSTIPELVVEAKDQLLVRLEHWVGHVRVSVPGDIASCRFLFVGGLVVKSWGEVVGGWCGSGRSFLFRRWWRRLFVGAVSASQFHAGPSGGQKAAGACRDRAAARAAGLERLVA
jgi:hypothetical protein